MVQASFIAVNGKKWTNYDGISWNISISMRAQGAFLSCYVRSFPLNICDCNRPNNFLWSEGWETKLRATDFLCWAPRDKKACKCLSLPQLLSEGGRIGRLHPGSIRNQYFHHRELSALWLFTSWSELNPRMDNASEVKICATLWLVRLGKTMPAPTKI